MQVSAAQYHCCLFCCRPINLLAVQFSLMTLSLFSDLIILYKIVILSLLNYNLAGLWIKLTHDLCTQFL